MIKKFYLKLLMSLLLVALTVPQLKADELTVANGTSTQVLGPLFDYNSSGFAHGTGYVEILYPKSLLNGMENVKITSITYYSNQFSFTGGTINVQICETESSNLNSEVSETPTTIATFSNVQNYYNSGTGKWTLDFGSNSFEYSGNKNLLVRFYVTSKGSKDGTSRFYIASTSTLLGSYTNVIYTSYSHTNGSSQGYKDQLPKTTFTYESAGPKPTLSADPTSLNFSTVAGTAVNNTVTVSGSNLTGNISAALVNNTGNAFSINPATITVSGTEAEGAITITYNPSAAGDHTATLRLTSDGAETVDVQLSGTATAPVVPTITVNPATLNINATVGETKTATFTVTGTDLTGNITVAASDGFTVSPTTIAAADAANGATVTVSFTPSVAGSKTGTITLTSAGADTKTVNINATATEAGTEIFTVDKESLDFGNVMLGQNKTLSVKITNKTSDNINPVFTFNNNVFSVEDDSYPVYGDLSQTYNIVYTPQAAGTDYGTLTISVGRNTVTIDLTGNCVEQAAYDITSSAASGVHNFGDAFVGGSATWNVTLTNNGANAVTPVIEWPENVEGFSAENVPASIPAGQSATITFKFAPTAIKAYGPTSIVVKFAETTAFQFDYTFRGNGIENTGTLPPSSYDGYTYTWTDDNGDEHTSTYSEIATDPNQMIALLKAIYTDKNMPGNMYRGYKADGTKDTAHPVAYPAIGAIARNSVNGTYVHEFEDAYGWGIVHDEANYPTTTTGPTTSGNYQITKYFLDPTEYQPEEEGLTLLLVEMNDGVGASTTTTRPTSYSSLKNLYKKMFKSVRVIPNSKRVTKDGVDGTLFKIDCDKMNRFFFLAKGRLRLFAGDTGKASAHFEDKVRTGSGSGSTYQWYDRENTTATVNPFNMMYEQFSPVNLNNAQVSSDVYQLLINMESYNVEHDCEAIPWASTNGVSGHEFNMYGKASLSDDCQDVRDLMFFVPDYRMMYYDGRDKGTSDMFVNYYKDNDETKYLPTMGMYVIRQEPITGEKIDGQYTYKLHLTWDSNLTDFVPSDKGVYYIYQVNEDGSYSKVGETNSQTKELYLNVNMAEHGQQVTYVIQGRDNTGFLSLQYSNEESFIIPGTNPYEKFQLEPNADYYSRFNPADGYNYYANGLQIKNYVAGLATSDLAGKKLMFYRQALNQSTWTKVAEVTVSGTAGTATMFEQRAQSDYKFGYKTNPELVVSTTGDYYNFGTTEKPFMVYDNLKDDVSLNIHPDGYRYKVVVDGTPEENEKPHSNVITIRVLKTDLSAIRGTFTETQVNNEQERTLGIEDPSFDIEVQQSSKTDILRYDAYRWGSEEDKNIIDPSSSVDNEVDIAPNGIAGNQGEYYTVAMNGDAYKGEDVYFNQGQTAQATFVDNVPLTTTGADEYTYAPVVEAFAPAGWGRDDYNTYGGPQHTTATGEIKLIVNKDMSDYTWEANGKTYRYYTICLDVDELNVPEGYEIAKVRAWRKIDRGNLGEKPGDYFYRTQLDGNGEKLFDETDANVTSLGSEEIAEGVLKGTFGALDVKTSGAIPMDFYVRMYFKKNDSSTPAVTYDPIYVIGNMGNGWDTSTSITQLTSTDGSNYSGTITTGNNNAYIIFTTELGNNNTYWFGAIDYDFSAPFSSYVSKYWGDRVKTFNLSANKTYNITVSDFHKKSDNYNGDNTAGTVAITEASAKAPMLRDTNDGKYYITELKINSELNSSIPTSICGVESYKVVTGIKYYNLAGIESDVPFKGVNIEVTTYEDGSRTSRKILK